MVTRPLAARDRPGALPLEELRQRACRLRVLLTDCDGVLTDGGVFVSAEGEAFKRFSLRDGMGVELLRLAGVESAIVTRERSPIVARRAEKLRLPLFDGVLDKAAELPRLTAALGCERAELGYIGDDVNDLGVIRALAHVGLTAAPFDATPAVARAVHRLCRAPGGFGAFREFADWILGLRADAALETRAQELTR
jgi:3-deoxy-D-manno-octulosonate 8-phosphate phosphatase (KDO 8-P phosphatase)